MGARQSQLGTSAEGESGILQQILPGKKEFEPLPIPKIIDLDFILANRPIPPQNLQTSSKQDNLKEISERILKYNREHWNFGNLQETPQKLMNENTYKLFLNFVKSKIVPNAAPFTISPNTNIQTKQSFDENISIIEEINRFGIPTEVNKFFTVKLSVLFPEISGFTEKDIINVTLLGLAAIIGAEHLVIYFLMCGANPGISYLDENEDTASLMLLFQIGLTKIQTSQKYFIILARMLYILFLLGSVGPGVDLSKIFKSNFKISIKNQGSTDLLESILLELVKMPYINIDLSNQNKSLIYLTMQNGASIPLLFKILEKNNIEGPKLYNNINIPDSPLGYTVLYSLLMNNTISGKIKLSLVWYLIKADANPLIIPNVRQNSTVRESVFAKDNQTEIQLLFALLRESNMVILGDLLKILSLNQEFRKKYDEFKISEPGVNQDKSITIQRLKKNNDRLRKILLEVEKLQIIQVDSAIKESALIGSIREQNKAIQQLSTKQNLAITNPVNLKYNALMQPQQPQTKKSIDKIYQNTKQLKYEQNLAIPQKTYSGQRQTTPPYSGGGKRITMRTFYLLKYTKYSKQPFKAGRPIEAAHNAYDFLKLHDKIGKKQITMTIYDIANNKKYKYIAKTLKDGKNVLKSYK